ncbi:aminopeptidase NAALADL1 [Spea bombifrons]|uniref:aminopeptidase NAALADL1 n=1 Tax=Spea bombifrons TaxID=233779 RepID=UPI00234BB2E9|nr:aminopeptidase NAALADL1 [Spea bombifrons]
MNLWKIVGGVLGGAVILAIGLLIGHFGISKNSTPEWVKEISQDVDEAFITEFMKEVDNKKIENNLRELSQKPHLATTQGDEALVKMILERWKDKDYGLDDAKEERYDVYLSFPDKNNPNNVKVLLPNGEEPFQSLLTEKNLHGNDQSDSEVIKPYAAYAPKGNPKGKLVYANQGKWSDFEYLSTKMNLTGTIAIVRYGGAGRSTKTINAAQFGVVGVIVYTDPKDINDGNANPSQTYPSSWYMPPSGVERGSYTEDFGDLLTFFSPAKNYTYRIKESEIKGIPPIPTQPIGFEDAKALICQLTGSAAPEAWQGSLGCTYNLGPGFTAAGTFNDGDVQVNVYNYQEIKSSANVMGIIRGSVEPDRYVMYGNHRDSWVHGAIDPSSGTAVMLEITRVLGTKVKQGKWRPRRSIIFGSWGAEEFGLIGSTEFAEDYYSKLRDRTAAYINVDISVFANATLRAQGTPPVQDVIFKATKQVQAPISPSLSVYDNWIRYFNRSSSIYGKVIPQLGTLGAGSDYAPFLHYLGITCMDFAYTYDRSKTSARIYPAYHTAYDTFDYAAKFIDPGFTSHQTVARTAGNVLLRLSDSLIIPLAPLDYWETLDTYYKEAEKNLQTALNERLIHLEPLKTAVDRYKRAAEALNTKIKDLKATEETPLMIRMINDQLMLLERAFINHHAMAQPYFSHVIWAPRSYSVTTFPGLANAYSKAVSSQLQKDWDQVHHQLTIAIQAVDNAASTLETAASI